MEETTLTPLQIPEIALSIISHLDPPAILSIRLVSFPINTLILAYQRSVGRSIAQRQFSTDIDWPAPDIDCLQKNFHLKTLTRLPKAYKFARKTNVKWEYYVEAGVSKIKGKRNGVATVLKPNSSYPAFLGRCARAILIIWTLNDIRRHIDPLEPLPSYVCPPPPPSRRQRLGRLFSRMANVSSKPNSASLSPTEANSQSFRLHMNSLAPRSECEVKRYLSTFNAARQTFLNSLPRNHRTDLIWVQDYLFIALARNSRRHGRSDVIVAFVLQQSPAFELSLSSDDRCERVWAWNLASGIVHARQSEFSFNEWARTVPFLPGEEEDWCEEAYRAKAELTRGDWRDRREAVIGT